MWVWLGKGSNPKEFGKRCTCFEGGGQSFCKNDWDLVRFGLKVEHVLLGESTANVWVHKH